MRLSLVVCCPPTLIMAQGAGDLCTIPVRSLRPVSSLTPKNCYANIYLIQGFEGICESTDWRNDNQGHSYAGYCPDAPSYVECCLTPRCGNKAGYCEWTGAGFCVLDGGHFIKCVLILSRGQVNAQVVVRNQGETQSYIDY